MADLVALVMAGMSARAGQRCDAVERGDSPTIRLNRDLAGARLAGMVESFLWALGAYGYSEDMPVLAKLRQALEEYDAAAIPNRPPAQGWRLEEATHAAR